MKNLLNLRKKKIGNNNEEIKSLRREISYLLKKLEEMDAVLDRQKQYSRRNCVLIHGIKEVEGEGDELPIKLIGHE